MTNEAGAVKCPFCHPDPAGVFHQGNLIVGLWDAFPVTPGHALLVPRRHVNDWFGATVEEQAELSSALVMAKAAVEESGLQPQGYNVGINCGAAAGQTVPHLHMHLIPRYAGDTPDPRGGVRRVIPGKADYWNGLPHSKPLITGESDPFGHHLGAHLEGARELEMAVAFIQMSGLERLWPDLETMLTCADGRLRVVTGDYLGVTDPDALMRLLFLSQQFPGQVEVRVYLARRRAFHPKAYLVTDHLGRKVSLVGSSNLSESALGSGVEWNYRDAAGAAHVADAFDKLWRHPDTVALTPEWIQAYRLRRQPPLLLGGAGLAAEAPLQVTQVAPAEPVRQFSPNAIQLEALQALQQTREEGNRAGLVVLATGLGKTYLAAFDSREFERVLFVAHRNEILSQASTSFGRVRPTITLGYYHGDEKDPGAQILFANVATLRNPKHLEIFGRETFDYVVIDEFHHADSDSYRRIIDYFQPRFLLGLTATPERSDGGDLLGLCLQNLVYRCDLARGIGDGLLAPFRYFGVPDTVDYSNIPWRSGRFDSEALENALAVEARAGNCYDHYRQLAQSRTLAFCCSQKHADFMGRYLKQKGLRVAVVHSGPSSDPRGSSLRALREGQLDVLCCVDIFNEGVDLPQIDTVMMLRPTESRILWLQQLGRGLRLWDGKKHLVVIDYIGNHRSFLLKPQFLFDLGQGSVALHKMLDQLRQGTLTVPLPAGCEVTYDPAAVDLLEAFLRLRAPNALDAFYAEFVELHGRRPLALEAYQERINPGAARQSHGSWVGYVKAQSGVALGEEETDFLAHLETTPMSKCYKMVLLLAMIRLAAFPGQVEIEPLTAEFARIVSRSGRLLTDLSVNVADTRAVRQLILKNPIKAWAEGKYFSYEGGQFCSLIPFQSGEIFRRWAEEIADWRLASYLDRSRGLVRKVIQSGGRPIVMLGSTDRQELPEGSSQLWADGVEYEADFVKVAVNVMRPRGGGQNVLPEVLRGWFGADAGRPGTLHEVLFVRHGDDLEMRPAD